MTQVLAVMITAALALAGDAASSAPARRPTLATGCPTDLTRDFAERADGPLRLARVQCHGWPSSPFGATPPSVSPDGGSIAGYGLGLGLFAGRIEPAAKFTTWPVALESGASRPGPEAKATSAFLWDRRSRMLWTALQDHRKPGGWATGPMRPAQALPDGRLRMLPALASPSGSLDAMLWINGDGLALAQFGTRGAYYRPEQPNPTPTVAFVDAARGRILDEAPLSRIVPELRPDSPPSVQLLTAAATRPPHGKPRALFRTASSWVVWTQGDPPRRLSDPYLGERVDLTLSPDGRKVLVGRRLPTSSMCTRDGKCEVGPRVEGVVAALHDLSTGARLWTVTGEDVWGSATLDPAFSPDGRWLLIGLPRVDGETDVAVVSVADGKVLQRLGSRGTTRYAMGFTASGREAWISAGGATAFYDVAP
jgi:hypothetical protein